MSTARLFGAADLPARASSVAPARAFVRGLLDAAGHPATDDVELLVSELLTNTVKHSSATSTVRLVLTDNGGAVHVDVIDDGSAHPIPHIPARVDPLGEGGRGLWLVRELSSAWGWRQDEAKRTVWFEIAERKDAANGQA